MFAALKQLAAPVAKYVTAKGTRILGKKTARLAGAVGAGTLGATAALGRTAAGGARGVARIGAGAVVGSAVAGALVPDRPRRRRKRRFPTALQMARYEQAQDVLKGHPGSPAMRKMLAWKFFSRYKWI